MPSVSMLAPSTQAESVVLGDESKRRVYSDEDPLFTWQYERYISSALL